LEIRREESAMGRGGLSRGQQVSHPISKPVALGRKRRALGHINYWRGGNKILFGPFYPRGNLTEWKREQCRVLEEE